jgi:hypothetical protein
MQKTLNLNLFPSEMIKDLTHVDDEFNKIHQHLQNIQKDTITDDIFNSMLYKNMLSSSSTLSPVFWNIFAISVSACPSFGVGGLNLQPETFLLLLTKPHKQSQPPQRYLPPTVLWAIHEAEVPFSDVCFPRLSESFLSPANLLLQQGS